MWKEPLRQQFGASLDMLERAIIACPEAVWGDPSADPQFWYVAYHTLFWLDVSLADPGQPFAPPEPFTLAEMDPAGVMPPRTYTQRELLEYARHCRQRMHALLDGLTDETAAAPRKFNALDGTVLEVMMFNMRHVHHHTGQLNLLLRLRTRSPAPRWVTREGDRAGELTLP